MFHDIERQRQSPRGTVLLTAPYNLGLTLLIPMLQRFRARYPLVQLDLVLDDSIANVIAQGFDLALRVGWLPDSRLHALTLGPMEMVVCGSAEYFARSPRPQEPEDLGAHPWVAISLLAQALNLTLEDPEGRRKAVKLKPALLVNSGVAACEYVRRGGGIRLLPDYAVRHDIAEGRLVRVLPRWRTRPGTISAVFANAQRMPPKLRVLIDFLKAEFAALA